MRALNPSSAGGHAGRRPVFRARGWRALLTAVLVAAALAVPSAGPVAPVIAATAVPAGLLGGGCSYRPVAGGYQWECTDTASTGGAQGSGGGSGASAKPTCTLSPLTTQEAAVLALPPAPAGHAWDIIGCGGPQPFVGTILVATGGPPGTPPTTPQVLAQTAMGLLPIDGLTPATAPPAGKDGLVGLPEWFWIPAAEWQPVHTKPVRLVAGPVWVEAIATPVSIVVNPGPGLPSVSCPGPGTPYNPALPASSQHTNCSYTYTQPSAGQPGNTYAAQVTVLWNLSWVGSGGSGGTGAGKQGTADLPVPVAAGEALVTGQ